MLEKQQEHEASWKALLNTQNDPLESWSLFSLISLSDPYHTTCTAQVQCCEQGNSMHQLKDLRLWVYERWVIFILDNVIQSYAVFVRSQTFVFLSPKEVTWHKGNQDVTLHSFPLRPWQVVHKNGGKRRPCQQVYGTIIGMIRWEKKSPFLAKDLYKTMILRGNLRQIWLGGR